MSRESKATVLKLFIGAFMVFVMLVICVSVSAEDAYVTADQYRGYASYEGSAEVSYHVPGSFYVTIPTSITPETNYTGSVRVYMENVEEGYHIDAYISNTDELGRITVMDGYGNVCNLDVFYDNYQYKLGEDRKFATWHPSPGVDMAETDITLVPEGIGAKAGTYTGVVSFRIEYLPD